MREGGLEGVERGRDEERGSMMKKKINRGGVTLYITYQGCWKTMTNVKEGCCCQMLEVVQSVIFQHQGSKCRHVPTLPSFSFSRHSQPQPRCTLKIVRIPCIFPFLLMSLYGSLYCTPCSCPLSTTMRDVLIVFFPRSLSCGCPINSSLTELPIWISCPF